ncbi:RidA family protein [Amycolatopsis acidicola]|uniref:RidA family protein n=1 Tax=Amycolatopsis acidicola TaxID=2596893 RepID=A0A5N0UNF5_9PSEU|nr:RidA family protein [Amycolatopsis acidicola]KAA9149310.1 RidA family protein [Amycolatopsis acidicola]
MSEPISAPVAQGHYRTAVLAGGFAYSAGMTPRRAGVLVVRGRVGQEVDVATASWAAGLAAGNALVAISEAAGGLDLIARFVRMTVYVRCTPEFTELSTVADGASAVVAARLGEDALPVRTAIGVSALPGGAPVEVDVIAAVRR